MEEKNINPLNGNRYTDQYKKRICRRCTMPGWTISSISEKENIPRPTIHRWLRDRGIKIIHENTKIEDPVITSTAIDLYRNLPIVDISKRLGVSPSTIHRILVKNGSKIRNQSESGRLRCKNKMIESVSKEEAFKRALAEEFSL